MLFSMVRFDTFHVETRRPCRPCLFTYWTTVVLSDLINRLRPLSCDRKCWTDLNTAPNSREFMCNLLSCFVHWPLKIWVFKCPPKPHFEASVVWMFEFSSGVNRFHWNKFSFLCHQIQWPNRNLFTGILTSIYLDAGLQNCNICSWIGLMKKRACGTTSM